jgi:transposase
MDVQSLPNDNDELKQLLLKVIANQETYQSTIDSQAKHIEDQAIRIEILEAELRLQRQKRFGASSEKHRDIYTEDLFKKDVQNIDLPTESDDDNIITVPEHKRKRRGQGNKKPLPQVDLVYDLSEEEKVCPRCNKKLKPIKDKTLVQYAIIPAQFYLVNHIRKRYACDCKQCIKTAEMPKQVIPKSEASPQILAYLMVSKFLDGLPLHRQEKIAARQDMDLPRTKTSRWLIKSSDLFVPMINLCEDQFFSNDIGMADETGVQVLKEDLRSPESKSYLWMRRGGPPDKPVVLVDYSPSRAGEIPLRLLDGFKGYLVTDAYAGYNPAIEKQGLKWVACNDHARRKYKEALQSLPKTHKKKGETIAEKALVFYNQLYALERKSKHLSYDERYRYRQEHSLPVWKQFHDWLLSTATHIYDEKTRTAINYTINHYEALTRYCEDGRLPISNIQCEHVAKTIAISRKNFLFCDTPQGAHASAKIYSIIETARANGHNPLNYLTVLMTELPNVESLEGYEALLPWNITPDQIREKMANYPTLRLAP